VHKNINCHLNVPQRVGVIFGLIYIVQSQNSFSTELRDTCMYHLNCGTHYVVLRLWLQPKRHDYAIHSEMSITQTNKRGGGGGFRTDLHNFFYQATMRRGPEFYSNHDIGQFLRSASPGTTQSWGTKSPKVLLGKIIPKRILTILF
jgi:hypothetical protein